MGNLEIHSGQKVQTSPTVSQVPSRLFQGIQSNPFCMSKPGCMQIQLKVPGVAPLNQHAKSDTEGKYIFAIRW